MPIEPQIPLDVKPVQMPDPMQAYGNALAIKSHIQQQALQGKQMQAIDLENQQRQIQMDAVRQYNLAMQAGMGAVPGQPGPAPASPTAQAPAPPPDAGFTNASGEFVANPAAQPATPQTAAAPPEAGFTNASGEFVANPAAQPAASLPAAAPENVLSKSAPAPIRSTPPAIPTATPQQPAAGGIAGIPTIDYDKVAQYLVAHGQGNQVMGVLSAQAKYRQELALQHKTEAEVHQDQMGQVAQAFQGVNSEATLQQALRTAVPLAQKYGVDASQFPAHYDPATTPSFISQTVATAAKLADFSRQAQEAADLQYRISAGIPKTSKDLEEQYHADISLAQNQGDLDLKNQKWNAIAKADPTGMTAKLLTPLIEPKWSPETSQDATLSSLKPDERVKYFTGQLNDASQRLKSAALRGPQAYSDELARQVGKRPELANLFPAVPTDPGQFDRQAMATQAANVGATGEQYITAQNTMQYRQDLLAIRDRLADISQQRADTGQQRADQARNPKGLTPGQMMIEKRNIDADENGTPSRPGGLNGQRGQLGTQLKTGTFGADKDGKPIPLTPQTRAQVQARYQAATDALQGIQFRKADLYGIQRPDATTIVNAQDGDSLAGPDGSAWKKQDGVVYYQSPNSGAAPPAAPPAATAPPVQRPAAPPAATAPTPARPVATPAAAPVQRTVKNAAGNTINVELRNGQWVNLATGKPL
jgi:hypothetical protein